MTARQKLPAGIFLTERQQHLYEVTGHTGPWTSEELAAAGIFAITSADPEPEPPKKVQAAQRAEDEARLAFDEAHAAWSQAERDARRARAQVGDSVRYDKFMRPIDGSDLPAHQEAVRAAKTAEAAWEAREDAANVLKKAKGEYRDALRAWHRSRSAKARR